MRIEIGAGSNKNVGVGAGRRSADTLAQAGGRPSQQLEEKPADDDD